MKYEIGTMKFLKSLYFLILLLLPFALEAQVKIFGKVTNADNEPIEFATIRIGGTAIGANTGLDGSYSISVAESDTIEVIATCIGYKQNSQKLIKPKGNVTLNIRLFRTAKELHYRYILP